VRGKERGKGRRSRVAPVQVKAQLQQNSLISVGSVVELQQPEVVVWCHSISVQPQECVQTTKICFDL